MGGQCGRMREGGKGCSAGAGEREFAKLCNTEYSQPAFARWKMDGTVLEQVSCDFASSADKKRDLSRRCRHSQTHTFRRCRCSKSRPTAALSLPEFGGK